MDNPQVSDISWLAGCLDSDGTITVAVPRKRKRGKRYEMRPQVIWSNSSSEYIEEISRILTEANVPHYISWKSTTHRDAGRLEVTGWKRVFKLLPVLDGYVRIKFRQWELLKDLVVKRRNQWEKAGRKNIPITDELVDIAWHLKSFNYNNGTRRPKKDMYPRDYTRDSD